MSDLPIPPGSDLDKAIDACVRMSTGEAFEGIPYGLLKLIDGHNHAHMTALGTRTWYGGQNVKDPAALVEPVYSLWYGKARS